MGYRRVFISPQKDLDDKINEQMRKNQEQGITPESMEQLIASLQQFYKDHPCEIDIFRLSRAVLNKLKTDRDFFSAVEGVRGTGKSNLLLLVCLVMHAYAGYYRHRTTQVIYQALPRDKPLDPTKWERLTCSFDFDKNMSFLDNADDLSKKFNSVERYGSFAIDEGSKNLHKHNWQAKVQFKLVQLSDTERYQNKSFWICIPNFKELNSTFRNDRIQLRIYLYVRHTDLDYASAVLSMREPGRWNNDPWFVEENEKEYERILRNKPPALRTWKDVIHAERKLRGYLGEIHIPSIKSMSPKIWDTYMKYKITNAQKELEKDDEGIQSVEHKQNQHLKYAIKKMMAFLKLKFPGLRYGDFNKLTTLPTQVISSIWKENIQVPDEYKIINEVEKDINPKRKLDKEPEED